MVLIQVDLDDNENKIVGIYKVMNGCYDKKQAVRDIIRQYDKLKKK